MSEGAKLVLDADATGLVKGTAALKQTAAAAAQAERAVNQNAAATVRASGAMGALGNMSNSTKGKIMSFGQQLQDVAVQAQMGTSSFTIAAQQGSQFLSVFGPMGAVLGAVAAIGLPIAGAAFASMGGNVKSAADSVEEFADGAARALDAAKAAKTPVNDLAKEYGSLAAEAKKALEAQAAFAIEESYSKMAASVADITDQILIGFRWGDANAQDLIDLLGVTREQAVSLQTEIRALSNAEGPRQVFDATVALRDALIAAGVKGANPLIGQLNAAEQAALDVLAASPNSDWMNGAITATQKLIGKLMEVKAARDMALLGMGRAVGDVTQLGTRRNQAVIAERTLSQSVTQTVSRASGGAAKVAVDAANTAKSAWQSAGEIIVDSFVNNFDRGFDGIVSAGLQAARQVGAAWLRQKITVGASGQSAAGGGGLLSGLGAAAGPIGFGISILGGLFGAARARREAAEAEARKAAEEAAAAQRAAAEEAAAAQKAEAEEAAQLQIELLEAQGKASEALAMSRQLELESISPANRALKERVWALKDEADATAKAKEKIDELIGSLDERSFSTRFAFNAARAAISDSGVGVNIAGQTFTSADAGKTLFDLKAVMEKMLRLQQKWDADGLLTQ